MITADSELTACTWSRSSWAIVRLYAFSRSGRLSVSHSASPRRSTMMSDTRAPRRRRERAHPSAEPMVNNDVDAISSREPRQGSEIGSATPGRPSEQTVEHHLFELLGDRVERVTAGRVV